MELHPLVDVAQDLHDEFSDGGGGRGEGGDGVGEDLREEGLEFGVVGEGQAGEHPVEHVGAISVGRGRRCRRRR